MSREATYVNSKNQLHERLIESISVWINPLGFRVIYLELIAHHQKVLRIYIDHLEPSEKPISIEDCVQVAKALDEPLDQMKDLDQAFAQGSYELEVSSPGINRPLRTVKDFEYFAGREVRIHVFRPLSGEELDNLDYQQRNPRQKNFLGILNGFHNDKVLLRVDLRESHGNPKLKKKDSVKKKEFKTNSEEGIKIAIPLPLISKANLEPSVNFEESDESE